MPLKPNKAASSTARQTRSVTRARNAAARPTTPNREDVQPASPPRPSNALSNSLARPTTANREDVSPPRPSNTLSNSSARPTTPNRDDVSPPRPSTPMSSHYIATPPNIHVFCHTASPAGRATSPAVVPSSSILQQHHSAFSFRHSSPPLISTNLAEMQNAFSFRHTATPPVITTPAEMHNAFSFRHTVSPPNVLTRHASSPPRTYHGMQASQLASPHVPIPLNDRSPLRFGIARPSSPPVPTPLNTLSSRFHSARPSSPPVPTPLNTMSSRFGIARPSSPPVPIPLNDRSPLRFQSARPSSPPVPTPLNSMSSRFRIVRPSSPPVPTHLSDRSPLRFHSARLASPPVPTPLNGISPRFRHARLARPSSPFVPTPLNSRYLPRFGTVLTPPRSRNGLAPISGQESGPQRMTSDPAAPHEANSSRQCNAFNITVDLTDSPLAAAPRLNATVDLTDSPFKAPIPPMENTGGASAPTDNSPAATPGISPIRFPVCLDGHARITSTGRRLMSTVCGHIFCSTCLPVCIRSSGRCPTCRSVIRRKDVHPVYI